MIMELSKEDQRYDEQWDIVDTFYNTQEPEGFGSAVTPEEATDLKTYYFIDSLERDIYEYRKQLAGTNPELVKRAEAAARKIAIVDGIEDGEIEKTFG